MEPIEQFITSISEKQDRVTTQDILAKLPAAEKPSRQYVASVVRKLVSEGKLVKGGSTRGAFYVRPDNAHLATAMNKVSMRFSNTNLKEHEIVDAIKTKALFFPTLKRNVQDIVNFSFSEMLNNAIEHSESATVEATLYKDRNDLYFEVTDRGIGVFRSIKNKKHLESELAAIQDLLKGKTTTMPQAHSGEGIFFTSKMADLFILESFDYSLRIDNELPDLFVEPVKPSKRGTRVIFKIRLNSNRHTTDVFQKYVTNRETFAFDKTDVQIRLYTMGTVHVSRSQARRVLSGLDKFKKIVLDFDRVPTIGQGFADEIFRVFQRRHPEIQIEAVNAGEAVDFMIKHVIHSNE